MDLSSLPSDFYWGMTGQQIDKNGERSQKSHKSHGFPGLSRLFRQVHISWSENALGIAEQHESSTDSRTSLQTSYIAVCLILAPLAG